MEPCHGSLKAMELFWFFESGKQVKAQKSLILQLNIYKKLNLIPSAYFGFGNLAVVFERKLPKYMLTIFQNR